MTTKFPRLVAVGILVLVVWMAALSAIAFGSQPSEAVVAWVPSGRLASMLAESPVAVIDSGTRGFVILRGNSPGFVAALYASGAWVVLPARRRGGCAAGFWAS